MKKILFFLFIGYSLNLFCQERLNLNHLASKYTLSSLGGFKKLLSIPNDANDKIGIQALRRFDRSKPKGPENPHGYTKDDDVAAYYCLLYTSPSPRD